MELSISIDGRHIAMAPPPMLGMAPAINHAGSSKRPRAFGRTSNVWQYVEIVQERTTPISKYRKSSAQSFFGDDDEEADTDKALTLAADALHPTAIEPRKLSDAARHGRLEPMPLAAVPDRRPSATQYEDPRASQALRNAKSVPDLAPINTNNKKASTTVIIAPSPTATLSRKPADVIKRIQALGISASAPYLASPQAGPPTGAAALPAPQASAIPSQTAATAAIPLSEAERMRNDFNSQRGRLYYGCSVAFELFNGHLMMVSSPDGTVGVEALEKMHLKSANTPSGRHRAVFSLIDLTDVRSASSIRYGDAVWLQLSVGPGETSWEQGGVLGAKVREAPQLKALALADDESIRNDAQAPLIVGHPVPVRAYLPKNRDDVDAQVDEIQSRVRNKSSKMLGKWIVRSAVQRKRKPHDNFVYNTDEVYLEQDWFYLGADSDAGLAVLRQLPPASALKEIKLGEYVVERRAAWRIRLLDSSNGSAGLSLAQQQMERLLLKAKTQLKHSRRMRAGQTKQYGRDLHGGAAFVTQFRTQLAATTGECDREYMAQQERRLTQLPQHLSTKADTLASDENADRWDAVLVENGDGFDPQATERPTGRTASAASSRTGDSTTSRTEAQAETALNGTHTKGETVCSLCRSSSIGYNLCCQIHHVMNTLHAEIEQASAALAATTAAQHGSGGSPAESNPTSSVTTPVPGKETRLPSSQASRRKSIVRKSTNSPMLAASASAPALTGQQRIAQLFAMQDEQLMNVIKYKENAAKAALAAVEQARVGLSPVAAQYRDRFKHVDQLAQQHAQDMEGMGIPATQPESHGIGAHFQKIHNELKREENLRRETYLRENRANRAIKYMELLHEAAYDDEDGEAQLALLLDTTAMCPLELPGEGYDVYGRPLPDASLTRGERLFPNEAEMEKLPPIDTKQALLLYLHNKSAVIEMLDGFIDIVETHIMPNLVSAMEVRNRAALLEFLDFAARAAEFVCARRVQVRVAQLLHVIADSGVGDFDRFQPQYEELLQEIENTVAFIRFYREKVNGKATATGKNKKK